MNKLLRLLILVAIACAAPTAGRADPLSDLERQILEADTRLKLATKTLELVGLQTKVAEAEKAVAAARLKAAQDELAAAQARLMKPVQLMRMSAGTMTVIRDQKLTCDALPFLRYTCNGKSECTFPVDGSICGFPGANTDAMELTLAYRCGDQLNEDVFWSGRPAFLTCK